MLLLRLLFAAVAVAIVCCCCCCCCCCFCCCSSIRSSPILYTGMYLSAWRIRNVAWLDDTHPKGPQAPQRRRLRLSLFPYLHQTLGAVCARPELENVTRTHIGQIIYGYQIIYIDHVQIYPVIAVMMCCAGAASYRSHPAIAWSRSCRSYRSGVYVPG